MSPHFFSSGFVFGEVPKIKVTFAIVLREVLFMLDVTQSQVEVETEFQVSLDTCVVSLSVISLDSVSLSILAPMKWYVAFSRF